MGTFFAYSIQSAICLAGFYLFYKVLLSRETFHRFNRIALLGILVLSLTIPFALTLFPLQPESVAFIKSDLNHLADGFLISGNLAAENAPNETRNVFLSLMLTVYLTGCFIFMIYSILSIFRVIRIIHKGTCSLIGNGTKLIVLNDKTIAPFSWMKHIVLSKSDYEEAGETIIAHETAHIRLHHSFDLIIAQICILTQWFNPAMWLLYQELQGIHEFEADDAVISTGIDAKQYQLLLIKKAVGTRLYSMANSFNHNNLKKRITMMLQKKSNPWARLKYAYVLPLAATTVALFAHPEISQSFEEISSAKVSHFALETSKNEVKNLPEIEISAVPSVASETVSYPYTVSDDSIYVNVEKAPQFPGGEVAVLRWIKDHMRYPETAAKDSIQGTVSCTFVIEKDGSVSNVEVVRKKEPSLDNEAVRLLKTLPKFMPGEHRGEPVRTRYSVPVRFILP